MTDDIVTQLREGHGQECKCSARCYCECACDAIWAEHYITEAADEIDRLRVLADNLAYHLRGYMCHCNMSKCKCGYDDVMDEYEEVRSE